MARLRVLKKHIQMNLDDARKEVGRGGWRRRAGRKKKAGAVSHDARPSLSAQHPQHVTLRLVAGAPNLAREYLMKLIGRTIAESHKPDFRIIEFNVSWTSNAAVPVEFPPGDEPAWLQTREESLILAIHDRLTECCSSNAGGASAVR